jgi:site-specific DNA-methyltransferase (adenine-specific)
MLEWIYASGFPKSHNVGKLYDKKMGNERDKVGEFKNSNFHITKGNSQWEGFGTALKPAHEPIVMARKPLSEKTIVENCIKHGAGALDIDGCRIPINDSYEDDIARGQENATNGKFFGGKGKSKASNTDIQGRFPANLAVTDDALNDGTITKSTGGDGSKFNIKNRNVYNKNSLHTQVKKGRYGIGLGDSGSKSRYFDIDVWGEKHGLIQCPKASKKERNAGCEGLEKKLPLIYGDLEVADKWTEQDRRKGDGIKWRTAQPRSNHHPTVKPIHLISWLIRLVSKDGDTVLDPFMGSGTTGVACKQLNRNFIGIESNEEYIKIAEKRIAHRNFLWRWYR